MIDMERRKFEDSFKEAFDGAEVSPSENVWTNIELDLEKADGGKIRRRLMFYKMLAAASIAFAMCVAGIGYYVITDSNRNLNGRLASSANSSESSAAADAKVDPVTTEQSGTATLKAAEISADSGVKSINGEPENADHSSVKKADGLDSEGSTLKNGIEPTTSAFASTGDDTIRGNESKDSVFNPALLSDNAAYDPSTRKLPALYSAQNSGLKFNTTKPDAGALLLARLAAEEQKYAEQDKKEKIDKSEKLWTSVGFSAGGFSSVNPSVSPSASSNTLMASNTNSSVPDKQASASGLAYSFGVSVGTKLSKRWVLQGGVNYLSQSSDYTATNVVGDNNFQTLKAESINELDKLPQVADIAKLAPTVPYSVNNNLKFFSVPVQAGYLLVNKKFGLQLNAGVSTDLFLQNTITPEGGSLDKTTQGSGEESPYRSVNFSGLMGTELSYRIGQRYRVALNPGIRYPFNSVYKSDVGIQSTPLTFDVGLRFRYIFH